MWGRPDSLAVENLIIDQQGGLAPRVFERLFARINEVSINFKLYSLLRARLD
jgi:hypothetical protein